MNEFWRPIQKMRWTGYQANGRSTIYNIEIVGETRTAENTYPIVRSTEVEIFPGRACHLSRRRLKRG